MTRHLKVAAALAALLLGTSATGVARAQDALELKVKAAFLFNFAKFTTWPPSRVKSADATLNLCVLGDGPMTAVLQDTVRGRTVGSHPIEVLESPKGEDLQRCHVAYIGGTDDARIAQTLEALSNRGVLTVHEASQAQSGGVIRFLLSDSGRVRFEVNVTAASREQLALSSKLLEVSQVVNR